jgi:hypothetical protein
VPLSNYMIRSINSGGDRMEEGISKAPLLGKSVFMK